MPIEFTESLFQNNDFKVTTNNDGDLVQTHQQTGAQFKFDATKNRWVPVQGLDLEGATIDNAGSIDVESLSATQLAQALDANGYNISNLGSINADAVDHDSTTNRTHQGDDLSPNSVDANAVNTGQVTDSAGTPILGASVASGSVTLASGTATIDTGVGVGTTATFYVALGPDTDDADVAADIRAASGGNYEVDIQETDSSVGNPTINYDIVRVR